MVTVIWPSGNKDTGPTWAAVEKSLRDDGWNPSDPEEYRRTMEDRAAVWNGSDLHLQGTTSEQLFAALAQAGICRIIQD